MQCRAERYQSGRRIADRGAVGDVAAKRPHRADLLGAETAEQLDEIGIDRRHGALGALIGDAGADMEAPLGFAHVRQTGHPS